MRFWTDKKGEELTFKQFIGRWKNGIKEVTPLNQTKLQCNFTWIMLIGIILGFVISLYRFKDLWWVSIILFGVAGNTVIQLIATYQKRRLLENIEKQMKSLEEPEEIKGFSEEILKDIELNPAIEEEKEITKEEVEKLNEEPIERFGALSEHYKEV